MGRGHPVLFGAFLAGIALYAKNGSRASSLTSGIVRGHPGLTRLGQDLKGLRSFSDLTGVVRVHNLRFTKTNEVLYIFRGVFSRPAWSETW